MSPAKQRGVCVYCGWPAARVRAGRGRVLELVTCASHADLLTIDPTYNLDGYLDATSSPTVPRGLPARGMRRAGPASPPTVPRSACTVLG